MFEVLSRSELRADGMTSRRIITAVRNGDLVRGRRDHYLVAPVPDAVVQAVRVGGRLTCLSLLAELGVFVFSDNRLHVHMDPHSSRMRNRHDRTRPLSAGSGRGDVALHWRASVEPSASATTDVIDALAHAARCSAPRHAVATLDSALNTGMLAQDQLADVFALLPHRMQVLRSLVDGRSEAGTETLVRLLVRQLGCTYELQVRIDGVGRVDLLVDGWLVVECDSRGFHSSWEERRRDFARDRALASRGYCVLRLVAEDILFRPDLVLKALRGVLLDPRHRR